VKSFETQYPFLSARLVTALRRGLLPVVVAVCAAFGMGCQGDGESRDDPDSETSIYVGEATDMQNPSTRIAAGFAVREGHLQFFACGDEAIDPFWVRVDHEGVDMSGEETTFDKEATWTLHGAITGSEAKGTLEHIVTGETIVWAAERVEPGDLGGLYRGEEECSTDVVVLHDGSVVRGSYCTAEGREQVIPLAPPGADPEAGGLWIDADTGGIWVELDTGHHELVERIDPMVH
jgi:hypothetical protein